MRSVVLPCCFCSLTLWIAHTDLKWSLFVLQEAARFYWLPFPYSLVLTRSSVEDFCGAPRPAYRGTRVQSRSLGIWALTVKQCQLSFAKMRNGGCFVFRFGWRGISCDVHPSGEQVRDPSLLEKYQQEEEWYKALTHWLFSVLKSLFSTLRPFKSEYVHQADVSFYMVCRQFDRQKYDKFNWEEIHRAICHPVVILSVYVSRMDRCPADDLEHRELEVCRA